MDSHELERLDAIVTRKNLAAGQMIFAEEDPAEALFNVTDGVVRIYKQMADGRRQITGFLFPGDFLGIAFRDRYIYSAEAVSAVSLCRFPGTQLERLMEDIPHFEKRLLQIASNELAAAQEQMMLLGRKSARERVATFLVMLYLRNRARNTEEGPILDLPVTRGDIADYLGLTIETVSRAFTRLKNDRLIRLAHNHKVELVDLQGLEDLCDIALDADAIGQAFGATRRTHT